MIAVIGAGPAGLACAAMLQRSGGSEHPDAAGLHFVGCEVTLGGAFRHAGIQAERLARTVAASVAHPEAAAPAPA